MRYREFGNTGLTVSEMCLGTWGIGGYGWDFNPDETKLAAIQAAIEEGINFFDTAPAYNAGAAERLLGEAVKKSGRRNELILATKCGTDLINGQYVRDASRTKIMDQIDKSLANLQTDYIDIYLLHWPSENVPEEEAIEAMADIRKSGKVRFIGVSNHSIEQRKAAVGLGERLVGDGLDVAGEQRVHLLAVGIAAGWQGNDSGGQCRQRGTGVVEENQRAWRCRQHPDRGRRQ